ncbi:type VI secretion system tube protein Hcp [Methylococcus sp. EFPC2]|uniref:Hcp family type VI secretion system effector n=1 Tax=Methylococcus sp. EFPC2 TaxID=2812648 RepID=UPI001968893B|nr:type VI secretion system tube protein Hcp [Methylococcus sp. EFPC2]QSA96403.1 type VI secretion system tube protein Hcp [Methylococcus sp. EFPC2]
MAIFLKFEPEIKGGVTYEGHKDWISISSVQFGVGRGIGSPEPGSQDRQASHPSISELVFTKSMDIASNQLFFEAVNGTGSKVTIDFVETIKEKDEIFYQIVLENALISGYSVSSGGDRPSESLSLNFTKITVNYNAFKDGKAVVEGQAKSWNLLTNRAS